MRTKVVTLNASVPNITIAEARRNISTKRISASFASVRNKSRRFCTLSSAQSRIRHTGASKLLDPLFETRFGSIAGASVSSVFVISISPSVKIMHHGWSFTARILAWNAP
jgi:hypothetical protein